MKNLLLLFLICTSVSLVSCSEKRDAQRNTLNKSYLDSIKTLADTAYSKTQYTADFAKAKYYRITKDSLLLQVMHDARDSVRQIITTKNNKRIYFAQFYKNGQLKGMYHFNTYGANDGMSEEYFENGVVKEKGNYRSGFRTGDWQAFDTSGNLVEKIKYNADGQRINE